MHNLKNFFLKACSGALSRTENSLQSLRNELESNVSWSSSKGREQLVRNKELRERHRGKPGFVIGNGPSLGMQNLAPLAGRITFAMSGFWKHPIIAQWQPTYYCFADPLFFDGSQPMRSFFAEMRKHVTKTTYVVPLAGRPKLVEQNLLEEGSTYYVSFQGTLDRSSRTRIDFVSAVPAVQSVSQLAIMSAIYMGCSPIYLIGLDHDWLAQRGADRHFYAGKTVEGHSLAHGDLDKIPYRSDLASALRLWDGYERLKTIAAAHGCEILNATNGGFLDVFPRLPYQQALFS